MIVRGGVFQLIVLLAGLSCMVRPATSHELSGLAFLSGCWIGLAGQDGTIQEFYTMPTANIMLGTTIYLREGKATGYEFTRIEKTQNGVVMMPYPNGKASEHPFVLTDLGPGRAVFEAPEHDYPKRILYSSPSDGVRIAQIDGGADDPEPTIWRMQRAVCDAAGQAPGTSQ